MIKYLLTKFVGLSSGHIVRVALWTFGLVLATLVLVWIAKKQLGGLSKTAKADFNKKFNDDFFNDTTRKIVMLFDYDALRFMNVEIKYGEYKTTKSFPYFLINEDVINQLKISPEELKLLHDKKLFTGFEIDDFLLGYFEDIGLFEKKKLIDISDVYNDFDWYLNIIWNNEEIKKYVWSQIELENDGNDIYEYTKYIYEKCSSYRDAKLDGRVMWWWKFKCDFYNNYQRIYLICKKYFKRLHLNKIIFWKIKF
jgi:hypothetical protein